MLVLVFDMFPPSGLCYDCCVLIGEVGNALGGKSKSVISR